MITNPQVGRVGASGAKASRPKLDLVMQLLREGDTLKVTPLDRLSRSVLHMFGMLSALAELQRELIVANTNDGLASVRARGPVGGRRPKLTEDQAALAQRLHDEREKTVQQIADMFSVPRSTAYGHLDKTKTAPRQPKKTVTTKP